MLDAKTFAAAVLHRPTYALLPLFENGLLDWMPSERYLPLEYWALTGKRLNLRSPRTFNEKIAWLKLHDHAPIYRIMADKLKARSFVEDVVGEDWLVPLLGVWDDPADIDFDRLPDRFVLKCTHGYGGTVVCTDASTLDRMASRERLDKTLHTDFYGRAREWAYSDPTSRIICEAYVDDGGSVPADYKFMCFNGRVGIVCVSRSVGAQHPGAGAVSFFLPDGTRAPFKRADYPDFPGEDVMPSTYLRMYDAAEALATRSGAPFVRVDFYSAGGRPYFSEFTFYPCGGTMFLDPPEYDRVLGDLLELPKEVA